MEVGFEFTALVAFKLIVYTCGSLVHLFLMVLILGQRRLRRLEWLFFALMAALFMWNSGNLLALNVALHYGVAPNILSGVSRLIPFLGLILAPPLLVHVHLEYATRFRQPPLSLRILAVSFYLPLIGTPWLVGALLGHLQLDPVLAIRPFERPLALWVVAALLVSALMSVYHAREVNRPQVHRPEDARFHYGLAAIHVFLAGGLAWVYIFQPLPVLGLGGAFPTFLMLVAVVPSAWVGYAIFRHDFLKLRVQRNLIYTIVTIFILLLYLDGIRQLGAFLQAHDVLPAVATETVMLFILVVLLEPVKKLINRALHTAFVSEFANIQKLSTEIQDFAQQSGDLEALKHFVEERVPAVLSLERVKLLPGKMVAANDDHGMTGKVRTFPIHRGAKVVGVLEVTPVTSDLSGDQFGALQLLADQMAAALELCELIGEKVKLERALAEKAKMAFLGEMAARIAHNVKNPLSSMKTLVQLLEEDSELPERVRKDCALISSEIDRLTSNISQVLRYAKPARDTDRPADLSVVVARVIAMMRPEAERRSVRLENDFPPGPCPVEGGEEAASDIVSNLVVNALEASAAGGKVRVHGVRNSFPGNNAELVVENEGPPIPPDVKEKIFEAFFTTRPGSTGLGLAIVARRAEEIGGTAECVSPTSDTGGTRFVVRFRSAQDREEATA